MIYLHKILPLIFSPLFLVLALIIIGIYSRSKKISFFGVVILIFFSLPIVASTLVSYLEKDFIPRDISSVEKAEAAIVLGGIVTRVKNKNKISYEFNSNVDRIITGINLYKTNKAPILILTRGQFPWSSGLPEGEVLKNFAINLGVLATDIVLTDNVQNTEQEAKAIKKIIKDKDGKFILITSAFHMPRALKIFNAYEINTIPFPVDFISTSDRLSIIDFIPSASSFSDTSFVVREMIGRFYYSLKY